MRRRIFAVMGLSLLLLGGAVHAQQEQVPPEGLKTRADEYNLDRQSGVLTANGDVRIERGTLRLNTDSLRLDTKTGDVSAEGAVLIEDEESDFLWRGETVSGNLDKRRFTFGVSRGRLSGWYYRAERAVREGDGTLRLEGAQFSTCDHLLESDSLPHYAVGAKRVTSRPDGHYEATAPTFRVMGVPFFYLPKVAGNATRAQGWHVSVGHEDEPGLFVLAEREFTLGPEGQGTVMVHTRQNNGLALGTELLRENERVKTEFLAYGLHDLDPPESTLAGHDGYYRGFDTTEDRFRLRLFHREQLSKTWSLWLQADWFSDVELLEDFFAEDERRLGQTRTYAELRRDASWWNFALRARPRINEFETVVERLPELELNVPRLPVGAGVEYRTENTMAHLTRNWRDYDDPAIGHPLPKDYDTWRLSSLHMLYRPFKLGALQVVPRAGGRLTWYADSSENPSGTDENLQKLFEADDPDTPYANTPAALLDYDDEGGSTTRFNGEVGLELSLRFYRTQPSARSALLRLDGLRHVVEPYVNYTLAPDPAGDRETLYYFDEIDRLTEQHFVRIGVRQEWQTRREDRIYELATLDTYADVHVRDEEDQGHAGNAGIDAALRPRESCQFDFAGVVDMDAGALRGAAASAALGANDGLRVKLRYAYWDDTDPRTAYSMGSSLNGLLAREWFNRPYSKSEEVAITASYPVNERTRLRAGVEYDLADQDAPESFLQVIRELHCWMGAFSVTRDSDQDVGFMAYLWLKAYPHFGIGSSMDFQPARPTRPAH